MGADDALAAVAATALRVAHDAVEVTQRERVPRFDGTQWRGSAASAGAEALRDLSRQLAGCRVAAEEYLLAARRVAAGG